MKIKYNDNENIDNYEETFIPINLAYGGCTTIGTGACDR